ncbi:hypothetical protein AX16_010992 [Volvariella volvacea WC 439]|nr:hypothetical protein AX16_010992 [Volvariella volvacea WC 439]
MPIVLDPTTSTEMDVPPLTINPAHPPPTIDPADSWENNLEPLTPRQDLNLRITIFVILGVSSLVFIITSFFVVRKTLRDKARIKAQKEEEKAREEAQVATPHVTPRVRYSERVPRQPDPRDKRVHFDAAALSRRVATAPRRHRYPYYINQKPPPSRTAAAQARKYRRNSSTNGELLSQSVGSPRLPATYTPSPILNSDDERYLSIIQESPDPASPIYAPRRVVYPSRYAEYSREPRAQESVGLGIQVHPNRSRVIIPARYRQA